MAPLPDETVRIRKIPDRSKAACHCEVRQIQASISRVSGKATIFGH
jgi:hypothetical protein